MKKFKYVGAMPCNATLRVEVNGKKEEVEISLAHGDEKNLPENNDYIKSLISAGHLVEVKGEMVADVTSKK